MKTPTPAQKKKHTLQVWLAVIIGGWIMHRAAPHLFKLVALWAAGIATWQIITATVELARRLRARAAAELRDLHQEEQDALLNIHPDRFSEATNQMPPADREKTRRMFKQGRWTN